MPKLYRALLVVAITCASQIDRCSGCGFTPERLQHLHVPSEVARPLVAAR